MVKQLNLLGTGQIVPTALHTEMEKSYLEYAMSVIVGRALPDVRDGLKPVHRRILYAMYELGLTPERPYRKCARVVGDVLGKYHPHGDQAVYDALVRMVQDFSCRYPLLAGHGNFGSVDNDPAAAMRYTETRLAPIAYEGMLQEISEATVNFTNNFDNSQQEPVVLPAQLPILLLNGCSGIAVGMATNVPPHNLGELVDGLITLIDKPDVSDEKLWELIPAPDFPTGGEIINSAGIKEAYATGKGIITVRGVVEFETIRWGKKRTREKIALIVKELPYQVNKAGWIEKVADLVNQGKLEGIGDVRDESDRDGMRVVIELKRDINPQSILKGLYHQTQLQTNFGVILLALVNNKPCQLSLRELLTEFLSFREETLTRQYTNELEQAEKKLHLLEGLLTALNNLDRAIDILRNAADGTIAKQILNEQLGMSDSQADSLLAMPMRRLTGLERQKLLEEVEELNKSIGELRRLLGDRHELMKALKKELRGLKRKFGDARRTRIINLKETVVEKKEKVKPSKVKVTTMEADAVVKVTAQGYIYWEKQGEQEKPLKSGEDFVTQNLEMGKQEQLVVFTDTGKAYPLARADIPPKTQKQTIISLLPKSAQRDVGATLGHLLLGEVNLDLLLLTEQGKIKRLAVGELNNLTNRGLMVLKMKEEDKLSYVGVTSGEETVAIAISSGRVVCFPVNEEQLPLRGCSAQGKALTLGADGTEKWVGCVSLKQEDNLCFISRDGYAKRLPANRISLGNWGDIGTQVIKFSNVIDSLVGIARAQEKGKIVLLTNSRNKIVVEMDKLPLQELEQKGDRLPFLKPGEKIEQILPICQ
ncbi:MAG: DNA topoisomerase 4 subunit A [Gomphosphaeria aponina SAG 52.96 = DSM 107014]|uniref:DNA topoisomerase (ATP-hydrolyzing) n=1 Tax=Gomphosphaeria aponina SAG 52.96 = DSM 107014 TaxID=1521640 RepID=A0A941JT92_9CHRO|nr:DNA topoisomerase 4 subunit A [Gomphosphaeria aponina SAG 52.96 = DSM 107014]